MPRRPPWGYVIIDNGASGISAKRIEDRADLRDAINEAKQLGPLNKNGEPYIFAYTDGYPNPNEVWDVLEKLREEKRQKLRAIKRKTTEIPDVCPYCKTQIVVRRRYIVLLDKPTKAICACSWWRVNKKYSVLERLLRWKTGKWEVESLDSPVDDSNPNKTEPLGQS